MCILFFNINDNCGRDGLRLVLANNRDESWLRPTKPASFWSTNECCLSGLDEEPGREGGTWLGVSRYGRIGCIVNFLQIDDTTKQNRGFIVRDFLTSRQTVQTYAESMHAHRTDYNGFTLNLIDLGQPVSTVARVTNDVRTDNSMLTVSPTPDDVFSAGNCHVDFPWRKVVEGERRFKDIVHRNRGSNCREKLTAELLDLMTDTHRYLPDDHLQEEALRKGWDKETTESKSSIFVWNPRRHTISRTTTIITVTGDGTVEYTERTLQTPVVTTTTTPTTTSNNNDNNTCTPSAPVNGADTRSPSAPVSVIDTCSAVTPVLDSLQWSTTKHTFTLLPSPNPSQ